MKQCVILLIYSSSCRAYFLFVIISFRELYSGVLAYVFFFQNKASLASDYGVLNKLLSHFLSQISSEIQVKEFKFCFTCIIFLLCPIIQPIHIHQTNAEIEIKKLLIAFLGKIAHGLMTICPSCFYRMPRRCHLFTFSRALKQFICIK